jgi:hypothetical protein
MTDEPKIYASVALNGLISMMLSTALCINACNKRHYKPLLEKASRVEQIVVDGSLAYSINASGKTNYFHYNGTFYKPTKSTLVVAEYFDRDNNGKFDAYYLNRFGEDTRTNSFEYIDFVSPTGSVMHGEFSEDFLRGVYKHLKYPQVDSIKFLKNTAKNVNSGDDSKTNLVNNTEKR